MTSAACSIWGNIYPIYHRRKYRDSKEQDAIGFLVFFGCVLHPEMGPILINIHDQFTATKRGETSHKKLVLYWLQN
jgi:hypothetical protein